MVWVGLVWAEEKMYFVTALSAPIASFNTVETKDTVPTNISENSQMNIGSKAVETGTIRLLPDAGPMKIGSLLLKDDTQLVGSENLTKWMIADYITVGKDSAVTVGGVLANKLQLRNSDESETTIQVGSGTLKVAHNITINDVKVEAQTNSSVSLQVGSAGGSFHFVCTGNSCGPETSAQVAKVSNYGGSTPTYKLIYAN